MKLTEEQIEEVFNWLKTWNQLKGTYIPLRFKEDFTKQLQQGGVSGKQLPLDFVKWYSGMEEEKILKAFNKWEKEVVCASGAVDKTVSVGCVCGSHDTVTRHMIRQCADCGRPI